MKTPSTNYERKTCNAIAAFSQFDNTQHHLNYLKKNEIKQLSNVLPK